MRNLAPYSLFPTSPLNDAKLGIFNRNKVVVSRTDGVTDCDFYAMMNGMERVSREVGLKLSIIEAPGNFETLPEYKPLGYPDTFRIQTDLGHGKQINSRTLAAALRNRNKTSTDPVLECILISQDLAEPNIEVPDWVYGVSSYPVHVISTVRWGLEDRLEDRKTALAVVGAHELCHSYDLVYRSINIGEDGLEANHCLGEVGPCIMEQIEIGKKTMKQMVTEVQDRTNLLCSDCLQEIHIKLGFFRENGLKI